ncbi:non-specific lipid transfer protein GPI-anchored 14-like [Nymphaea colorata]|nr:non-specific lipid transfer protein GPI-anchored 14-like [Nymphaea colorata]
MASSWMVSGMVLLVVAAGLVVSSAEEQNLDDCITITFTSAVACQYVNTEGAAPDATCCEGLKEMKDKFDFCFCRFLRDSANTTNGWYTPNYANMLQAPEVCGVPNGISDCPAILGLPADSPDALVFKTQKPAAFIKSASPASSPSLDTKPTFSSSSFPFALPPEAAFSMSGGVVAHIFSLGTVLSSMAVAAWILA